MYTLSIKYQPKFVSFSGGGAKGQCYTPVVYALEKSKFISGILVYSGSSAGAITAAVLATGITAKRFEQVSGFNLIDLLDYSCISKRGIYDGDVLLGQVRQILEIEISERLDEAFVAISKMVDLEEEITCLVQRLEAINCKCVSFSDFSFLNTIVPAKVKQLVITGTNIDDKCLEYFSAMTTPDMEVALAVRISASFPMVFKSIYYNNKNFADGGIINNLPTSALYELSSSECDFLTTAKKKERTLLFILGQKEKELIQNLQVNRETKLGSLWGNYRFTLSYNFFNPWNLASKLKTRIVGVDHDFCEAVLYDDLANNYMKQLITLDTYGIGTLDFDKKLTLSQRHEIEDKLVKHFLEHEYVYEFNDPVKFLLDLELEDITKDLIDDLVDQSSENPKKREGMQKLLDTIARLKVEEKSNALLVINQIKTLNYRLLTEDQHCVPCQETIDEVIVLNDQIKSSTKPLNQDDQKIIYKRLKIALGDKLFQVFKNNIVLLCDKERYQKPEDLEYTKWWKYSKALLFLNYFFSVTSTEKEKYIDVIQKEKILDFLKEKKIESFQLLVNAQLLTEMIHMLSHTSDLEQVINLLETIIMGYQATNLIGNSKTNVVATLLKEIQELEVKSELEDFQLYTAQGYTIVP